jgi:hypothetical protein
MLKIRLIQEFLLPILRNTLQMTRMLPQDAVEVMDEEVEAVEAAAAAVVAVVEEAVAKVVAKAVEVAEGEVEKEVETEAEKEDMVLEWDAVMATFRITRTTVTTTSIITPSLVTNNRPLDLRSNIRPGGEHIRIISLRICQVV